MTKKTSKVEVMTEFFGPGCPMCRDNINAKSGRYEILKYKRPYLRDCEVHLKLWDEADAADRKKSKQ